MGFSPPQPPPSEMEGGLNFGHFKIFFAGAAFGAGPVEGDVLPAGAGGDSFFGRAFFFLVYPAANLADENAGGGGAGLLHSRILI